MAKQRIGTMMGSAAVTTFLGLPAADEVAPGTSSAIVGAPCATPYPSVGAYCAEAPQAIRAVIADYAANVAHMDFDLGGPMFPHGVDAVDLGDLPYDEDDAAGNRERIRATIAAILDAGAVPVVLGGDNSIPIPVIEAYADRGDHVVLQIDAHIDFRDEVRGERLGLSSTMRRASEMAHVSAIVQVGQRSVGSARPGDHTDAVAAGVAFFPARQVHRDGIQQVIDAIPAGADVIIDLDCDAFDPAIVPGVIGRAPGGLTYWHVVDLLQGVSEKARIAGFTLVEYMPDADVDAIGALTNARVVCNILGLVARQSAR